ncbi:MAG: NAD-dependent epimerase/dehydratase family protein [Acidimicrobiales bacterium]
MSDRGRVVVAGVSGVVGYAAARRFAASGWDVVGLSRRRPPRLDHVPHRSVDLADAEATAAVVNDLGAITHLVYAALYEKPGLISGWRERDQMDRNLTMLANLLGPLSEQTELQHVSILQGTKAYGAHVEPMKVPGRERNPRHSHENFYWLQEDYVLAQQEAAGHRWGHTILRPQVIFGEAQGGNMNALPALGVYAALLKHDGRPLDFPGGVAPVSEAVDADLVAEMLEWAANAEAARNQTFNVTNGDVYTMANVWPVLAEAFGMEVGDGVPCRLALEMPEREADWSAIVDRFALHAPASLDTFVGQSFIYADLLTGYGQTALRSPSLVSTIKARRAGFESCLDTEDMFARLISVFQDARLLPPRHW